MMNQLIVRISPIDDGEQFRSRPIGQTLLDGDLTMEVAERTPCRAIAFFLPDGARYQIDLSAVAQAIFEHWLESGTKRAKPAQEWSYDTDVDEIW